MLAPGAPALNREQAIQPLEQLVKALREIRRLYDRQSGDG
jgi:hypothetical protein